MLSGFIAMKMGDMQTSHCERQESNLCSSAYETGGDGLSPTPQSDCTPRILRCNLVLRRVSFQP